MSLLRKSQPLFWLIVCFTAWLITRTPSPIRHGPGMIAPDTPVQTPLTDAPTITHGDFRIHPQASFEIEARVLSRENYRFDDGAKLSPVDLALGWGAMSDETVLDQIDISQGNRFFYWQLEQYPIPRDQIIRQSANIHLIPADKSVLATIKQVRAGHIVRLRGKLVNAEGENGWFWRTSLTRDDTGSGACELFWVESAMVY